MDYLSAAPFVQWLRQVTLKLLCNILHCHAPSDMGNFRTIGFNCVVPSKFIFDSGSLFSVNALALGCSDAALADKARLAPVRSRSGWGFSLPTAAS